MHPFGSAGRFHGEEADSPFVVEDSYPERFHHEDRFACEGLGDVRQRAPADEAYVDALADAGLLVECLRETDVRDSAVTPARWQRLPLFLHVRALEPR